MTEAAAKAQTELKDAQFSVNKETGLVTATIGNATVEVSADGKKVTASAKDGVEIKAVTAAAAAEEGTKISLSKDFNAVVLNGVTIEQAADGHLVITAPGGTVITKPAPANDTAVKVAKDALEIGDKMTDGTIYAGISPDTNQPMYAAPADAPMSMDFNAAAKYAKDLEVGGKKGFRVPSKAELNVMFQNREKGALKGTFNLTGSGPAGWYWSDTPYGFNFAYGQRFSDGYRVFYYRLNDSSVRCVR